ncbi:hypothetical protein LX32DRAFT_730200, partial [Colletotrichum zoysiae]
WPFTARLTPSSKTPAPSRSNGSDVPALPPSANAPSITASQPNSPITKGHARISPVPFSTGHRP